MYRSLFQFNICRTQSFEGQHRDIELDSQRAQPFANLRGCTISK